MPIDPRAAEAFARGAAAYEQGRPGYPDAAVAFLVERLRLGPGATVVDVAAGTGKLARLLVASGARVIAVEPVAAMRRLIPGNGIEVRAGAAERLPLATGDADAVTVAQAFHWFRAGEALRELHRALRPAGALAIVRNRRDPADPAQAELLEIRDRHGAHPSLEAGLDAAEEVVRSRLFARPELRVFTHVQELDRATLLAQAASESSIALLEGEARGRALADLDRLAESLPARFALRFETEVLVADRR